MLSAEARTLTYILAALYAVLGAILFLWPTWSSAHFAWQVSPFVAATIGGWCLGNGVAAFLVARRWRFPLVASSLVYLAAFGILETVVALVFFARLNLGHWLGWLYVAALLVNLVAAARWARDWLALRPAFTSLGRPYKGPDAAIGGGAALFVAFLGLYGLFAPPGSRGLYGGIFPELISIFTLRSFGAFYLSVALGLAPLAFVRGFDNIMSHLFISQGLLVLITLASLLHIGVFDFAGHPGQLLYLGTYVLVVVLTWFYLFRNGTGRDARPADAG